MRSHVVLLVVAGLLATACASWAETIDLDHLQWSVQYMIDTSQSDFGQAQDPYPRDNRGMGMSPDGRYLYLGYNNSYNSSGEVRKIDLAAADYIDASVARATGVRGKGIAVDDQGRVYLAEGASIKVYDANLSASQYTIATTSCEGVAVVRDGGTLYLYGTDRNTKTLAKWALTESGGLISGDSQVWQASITGASSLRGCEVDSSGRIWMADQSANKVFRVNSDGTGLASAAVTRAMDIGFDGTSALVTQAASRTISALDADMNLIGSPISVPWTTLELDPDGQSAAGALSGIVVLPGKGFYVTNETGQTANEKSTYGRIDANSGWLDEKFYTDLSHDDNDAVLFAVPEPSTLVLLGMGIVALICRGGRRPKKRR